MTMYLERIGATAPPSRHVWSPADCALYALSVGAGLDDDRFVIDRPGGVDQDVYPTFLLSGVVADAASRWPDPGFTSGDFDLGRIVLGEQGITFAARIPAQGDVTARTRLSAILDKGSGAIVVLDTEGIDNTTHQPMFTANTRLFISGEGGFGGDRSTGEVPLVPPDRPPDQVHEADTLAIQTLLYRYAGNDRNAIHADAEVAKEAGYRAPILMGQNVLGFACRALVECLAGNRPSELTSISGRFAAAGYNGDRLITEIWSGDDLGTDDRGHALVAFQVRSSTGDVLVNRGRATLRP